MLFVSISFALGTHCEPIFFVEYVLKKDGILFIISVRRFFKYSRLRGSCAKTKPGGPSIKHLRAAIK